jgi:hypothetical protein
MDGWMPGLCEPDSVLSASKRVALSAFEKRCDASDKIVTFDRASRSPNTAQHRRDCAKRPFAVLASRLQSAARPSGFCSIRVIFSVDWQAQ